MASHTTPGTADSNLSKKERREAARAQALKIQEAERKSAARVRAVTIVSLLLVVALVISAVAFILANKKNESVEAGSTDSAQTESFAFGENAFTEKMPENVDEHGGISLGSGLKAGSENKDKPVVRIYFDYLCVHCNELEKQFGEELTRLADQGEITLVNYPVAIMGQGFSTQGAIADFYLAENAPQQYADFHNTVFTKLTEPFFENYQKDNETPLPSVDDMIDVAKEVGISDSTIEGLKKAFDDKKWQQLVTDSVEQFRNNQLTGTPTVVVNDKKVQNWNTSLFSAIKDAGGNVSDK